MNEDLRLARVFDATAIYKYSPGTVDGAKLAGEFRDYAASKCNEQKA